MKMKPKGLGKSTNLFAGKIKILSINLPSSNDTDCAYAQWGIRVAL